MVLNRAAHEHGQGYRQVMPMPTKHAWRQRGTYLSQQCGVLSPQVVGCMGAHTDAPKIDSWVLQQQPTSPPQVCQLPFCCGMLQCVENISSHVSPLPGRRAATAAQAPAACHLQQCCCHSRPALLRCACWKQLLLQQHLESTCLNEMHGLELPSLPQAWSSGREAITTTWWVQHGVQNSFYVMLIQN